MSGILLLRMDHREARAVWHAICTAVVLMDAVNAEPIAPEAPLYGQRDRLAGVARRLDSVLPSPDLHERDAARARALLNVERAAREVDALFGGKPDRWTFDRKVLAEDAATALLSLHDYLNDVENEG